MSAVVNNPGQNIPSFFPLLPLRCFERRAGGGESLTYSPVSVMTPRLTRYTLLHRPAQRHGCPVVLMVHATAKGHKINKPIAHVDRQLFVYLCRHPTVSPYEPRIPSSGYESM